MSSNRFLASLQALIIRGKLFFFSLYARNDLQQKRRELHLLKTEKKFVEKKKNDDHSL